MLREEDRFKIPFKRFFQKLGVKDKTKEFG